MGRKAGNRRNKQRVEVKREEGVRRDDKQMRSLVSFGMFPLAYCIGFLPEMSYMKQMLLFAVALVAGNIALMRLFQGKQLVYLAAGLFILGSALNIVFLGVSQSVILVVLGVVFALKMKDVLGRYS